MRKISGSISTSSAIIGTTGHGQPDLRANKFSVSSTFASVTQSSNAGTSVTQSSNIGTALADFSKRGLSPQSTQFSTASASRNVTLEPMSPSAASPPRQRDLPHEANRVQDGVKEASVEELLSGTTPVTTMSAPDTQ